MKAIVLIPNPVLTTPSKTVKAFDAKLHALIKDMIATLEATKNPRGVGLAAPQIGEPWRVFITRPKEKGPIRAFINPEILSAEPPPMEGKYKNGKMEGCLSIPKVWGDVKRSYALTLRYQDIEGKSHDEVFTGFVATIVQHETDHINGILYTHRVLEQKGKFYQASVDKDGKEVLEEIRLR